MTQRPGTDDIAPGRDAEPRAGNADRGHALRAAVINFLATALLDNPHRVGKQLSGELSGIWAARRGTYRVLYRINDSLREVVVLRIEHRRDAYRPM